MTDDSNNPLGGLDLGALLGAAQNMQAQMHESQQRLAETVVEGSAAGGLVKVGVTAAFQFEHVVIDPEAINPQDTSELEDLVLAALRDAANQIAELQAAANPLAGLGDSLGGSLGGLGGLLGGA
ncbi:MAG: YbaB/EbfC family nucleoid-associated protein [Microthrixaceae bacterium]|nr:YbaB/EbfC family nucleoid-associated protein [Microthrixaceae bacterium]MCO5311652.1 YbaB/EbfC family nucleoid-associated protein [Microthrixaceae bacterium]